MNKGKNIEKSFFYGGAIIDIETNENLKDYNIINKSKILINNEKKDNKKENLIVIDNQLGKEKENNVVEKEEIINNDKKDEEKKDINNIKNNYDFENLDYNNIEKQNNKNKKFNILGKFQNLNQFLFRKDENKLEEIKDIINSLHKNSNTSKEDYINKGEEIFKIMNKGENKINRNEINNYFVNYLFEEHNKDKSINDKMKYFKILKELNKYIEIKKIQKLIVHDFFVLDKEEGEEKGQN